MKLVYKGKYHGEDELPVRDTSQAVAFEEKETMAEFSKFINKIGIIIFVVVYILYIMIAGLNMSILAIFVALLSLIPHEFLHALCFKDEVFLFTNLKQGMLFVTGSEDMSKKRFIFMSMLPNLVFGFIPFIIFLIHPSSIFLGTLGMISIPAGAGDYYNVYNCITQVPEHAKVFMSGMHTYWYEED